MEIYSLVECIKADDEGVLVDGGIYTVMDVTQKGNLILFELTPPSPYTTFDKHRFQDTGKFADMEYFDDEPPHNWEGWLV